MGLQLLYYRIRMRDVFWLEPLGPLRPGTQGAGIRSPKQISNPNVACTPFFFICVMYTIDWPVRPRRSGLQHQPLIEWGFKFEYPGFEAWFAQECD